MFWNRKKTKKEEDCQDLPDLRDMVDSEYAPKEEAQTDTQKASEEEDSQKGSVVSIEVFTDRIIFNNEEYEELLRVQDYIKYERSLSYHMNEDFYSDDFDDRFSSKMNFIDEIDELSKKFINRVANLYSQERVQEIIGEYKAYSNILENALMLPVIISPSNDFSEVIRNFQKASLKESDLKNYMSIDTFEKVWCDHKARMLSKLYDIYSRSEISSIEYSRIFLDKLNQEYLNSALTEGQYLGLRIKHLTDKLSAEVPSFQKFVAFLIAEYNDKFESPYYAENFDLKTLEKKILGKNNMNVSLYLPVVKKPINKIVGKPQNSSNFESYQLIINEFRSYQTDLVKMMSNPILANLDDDKVNNFYLLCLEIERSENDMSLTRFEVEWMKLKSHADKEKNSHFNDKQKVKFKDSKALLSLALNEESTVNEKELSIKSLENKLIGVLPINDAIIDGLKQQVGLKQLEYK